MINKKIPIASIDVTFLDWPTNGDHALIVYVPGCKHNCVGCQSPDLQYEEKFSQYDVYELAAFLEEELKKYRTDKIIFSGGDPLYHSEEIQSIIDYFGNSAEFCIYTGFDYKDARKMVHGYSYIKTGFYDKSLHRESKKTDSEMVLASSNQEIHDENGKLLTENGILKF